MRRRACSRGAAGDDGQGRTWRRDESSGGVLTSAGAKARRAPGCCAMRPCAAASAGTAGQFFPGAAFSWSQSPPSRMAPSFFLGCGSWPRLRSSADDMATAVGEGNVQFACRGYVQTVSNLGGWIVPRLSGRRQPMHPGCRGLRTRANHQKHLKGATSGEVTI